MRGFVAEARRIGAELPGALQIHRLRIEDAHQSHGLVHAQDFGSVLRKRRQRRHQFASGTQDLPVVNFELGNCFHARIMPGVSC